MLIKEAMNKSVGSAELAERRAALPPRRSVTNVALPPASMQACTPVDVDSSFRWNDNEAIDAFR